MIPGVDAGFSITLNKLIITSSKDRLDNGGLSGKLRTLIIRTNLLTLAGHITSLILYMYDNHISLVIYCF